jgi:DNA polymerase-3 subunit delta'
VEPSDLAFRQTASLSHPGLFVLRRSWRAKEQKLAQNIAVEDIRRLRHFLQMTPASAWRVVIIDSAEDLNVSSANALLKSLEEPPARTVFLILCSAPGRLPPTIMSRCRRLHLRPLAEGPLREAVRAALARAEHKPPSEAEMAQLALLSDGSPRRALELIAGGGLKIYDALMEILRALPVVDFAAVHRLIARVQGKDAEQDRDMLFSLIGATLSRLVRVAALGGGGIDSPNLRRLITPATLGVWAELWENIGGMQGEAERLNLDRPALILGVFGEIEKTARRCALT